MVLKSFRGFISSLKETLRGAPKGAIVIWCVVLFLGIFGPYVAPHDPVKANYSASLKPPFWMDGGSITYALGTDSLGRDMLSRVMCGARVSLIVGFSAVFVSGALGILIACASGYLGGWLDIILMRLTDTVFSIPFLVLAVVLAIIMAPGLLSIIVVLVIVGWTSYARVLRGEVLRIKQEAFIKQARITGCSTLRIFLRHIIPNIMNTFIVLGTLQLGIFILAEAALSFLGFGIQPPDPAWGSMVAEGREFLTMAWWVSLLPGLAIVITVFGANLMGDWLRVRLDPKFREV